MKKIYFEVKYTIDDRYVGNHSKTFKVPVDEIEDDMRDEDLEQLFYDRVDEHFRLNANPYSDMCPEFVSWAKEQIKNRER